MTRRRVAVCGSTGSIGTQTLDVVRSERDRFDVDVIAAGTSVEAVVAQVREFAPSLVVMATPGAAGSVAEACPGVEVAHGPEALADAARRTDVVVTFAP